MLTISHLSLNHEQKAKVTPILKPFDLLLQKGQVTALIGESGAGKSLLALALMQLLPFDIRFGTKSQVLLDKQDLLQLSEADYCHIRGKRLSMVFQEPMTALNPVRTVGAQIRECLTHLPYLEQRAKMINLLSCVDFDNPVEIAKSYPHQLSGGMRQRVVIAIALAQDPDILIADEPTTALDAELQTEILDLLLRLVHERNMALLLISHDLALIKRYADNMALLYRGELLESMSHAQGEPLVHPYAQLLAAAVPTAAKHDYRLPEPVTSADISAAGCPFAPRCPLVLPVCTHALPAWVDVTDNTDFHSHKLRCCRVGVPIPAPTLLQHATVNTPLLPSAPTISLVNVWARHPKQKQAALKAISLTLHPGKTLAIVGRSGSGKSTLAKVLSGLLRPTEGDCFVDGKAMSSFNKQDWRQFRRQVQWVLQDPFSAFDPRWRVDAILAEGVIATSDNKPTLASLRDSQIALLAKVGLSADMLTRYPHEFSGGQRQRLAIARALAVNPRVIICDEPTSALDVLVQAQILNLLKDLQQQYQLSYCLISHNMDVVRYLADEIVILQEGQLIETDRLRDLLAGSMI